MQVPLLHINEEYFLSALTEADVPALVKWLAEKQIADQTLAIPYPYSTEDALWFINFLKEDKMRNWAIRTKDGLAIGCIGFQAEHRNGPHCSEIGYWLAKPYWGKGIVLAAVKKLCEYGFNELNFVRIEAPIFAFNKASQRVVEKAGFEKEGHLRKAYFKNGEYFDGVLYSIIK